MYNLTKKEKLNFVLEKFKELEFSAYEISKQTKLTEAGVSRILKGVAKNPHETSLDQLILFLEAKTLGTESVKVEEPENLYGKLNIDINKYIACIETEAKLRKEINRLQGILRKNKIEFDDNFEL